METYHYNCNYCQKEYIPTRRGVQKYCSNSCRSRANQLKKKSTVEITTSDDTETVDAVPLTNELIPTQESNSNMTTGGVKDSTAGTIAGNTLYDVGKRLLTPSHLKPATKGDISRLEKLLVQKKYLPITNMLPDENGALPYYNVIGQIVEYLFFEPN